MDPDRNMYYIPVIESCALHVNVPQEKEWGYWRVLVRWSSKMGLIITGSVTAMDVIPEKLLVNMDMQHPNLGGLMVTKGV